MIFEVKIHAKARRNEIIINAGSCRGKLLITVKVTAAPERGKANGAIIKLLADKLNIKKSDITILRGQTSQNKIIEIKNITAQDVINKIK